MIALRRIETEVGAQGSAGPLLGRYDPLELIGRGGTSTVYRALDFERRGRDGGPLEVALKIVRADVEADPDLIASLHIEARRLVDLAHPNIVRVFGSGQHGEHHFLVMEFLRGRTLASVLKDRPGEPLPPAVVFRAVREIGAGLAYAHARGFLHGDLKPGNVFITADGRVKLLDFGTARALDASHVSDDPDDSVMVINRLGAVTPAYASPEMLAGEPPCESDDVFSFAVTCHLMLTGAHPYGPMNAADARREGLACPRAATIGARRADALAAALAFERAARTQSVSAFTRALAGPDLVERLFG